MFLDWHLNGLCFKYQTVMLLNYNCDLRGMALSMAMIYCTEFIAYSVVYYVS